MHVCVCVATATLHRVLVCAVGTIHCGAITKVQWWALLVLSVLKGL